MSDLVYAELELPPISFEKEEEEAKEEPTVVVLELSPTDENSIQI
jgi:hypothetical protein